MSLRIRIALLSLALTMALPVTANAGGSGPAPQLRDTVGLFRSSIALWILRSSNSNSCPGATLDLFVYGIPTDTPLAMDVDGDGIDTPTLFRNNGGIGSFYVRANNNSGPQAVTQINFGQGTDLPVTGNFDGTGGDEVGVFRNGIFFLRLTGGTTRVPFGQAGDIPIAGNWDGSMDGSDEIGLFRPSTGQFFLRANNNPGPQSVTVRGLGGSGDTPLGGDFDADDTGTIAVFRDTGVIGGRFFFNNMTSGGGATDELPFGAGIDQAVVGDWDGGLVDNEGCPPA